MISISALYSILVDHLEDFMNNVTNCFEQGFKVHSFKDPAARGGTTNCNEVGLFASLATIIFECDPFPECMLFLTTDIQQSS
jgi:hypothetical protein